MEGRNAVTRRLLDLTLGTPEENLALDEALLLEAERAAAETAADGRAASATALETLRLWESPTYFVAVGVSGRLGEEVRMEACRADRVPFLRRASAVGLGRIGDTSQIAVLQTGAGNDLSATARAAMAFALQKLGQHYVTRLVDFLGSDEMVPQLQGYFIELGPSIEKDLLPRLQEPDEVIRARVADILGAIGGDASVAALQSLKDRDRQVVDAAQRAVERIKLRRG